jgi:hypothetical protein
MATKKRKLSAKDIGGCHPKHKGQRGKCLPAATRKRLVKGNCAADDEHCMLDASNLVDGEKLRTEYLRPRYPNAWKQRPDTWLDNFQIAEVMKQYEQAYPWFRFMGALPIDFSAPDPYRQDRTKQQCLNPGMCGLDLKQEYEKGIRGIGCIFNLDPHFKGGSHWVGLYIDLKNVDVPMVSYSDSYGFKPPRLIARFMKALRLQAPKAQLAYNARRFQRSNTECGMYSLYFIICMIHGVPFKNYVKEVVPDSAMLELRKVLFS